MILDSLDLVAHGELKLKVKGRGSLHSIIRCTRVPPDASYRSLGMSRTRHIYLIAVRGSDCQLAVRGDRAEQEPLRLVRASKVLPLHHQAQG